MPRFTDDELFAPPLTFMGLPHGRPSKGRSRAAVVGLPFDCGTHPTRVGARGGPDAVRQMSVLMRRFNPTHADWDPLAALNAVDCGNVRLTPGHILDAFERIEEAIDRVLDAGAVPVTIGGDGSVSVPVARACAKRHKGMVLLHIDSHTDAYDVNPQDRFTSSDQFTHIAEEGLVDVERSWHLGIRSTTYFKGVIPKAHALGYRVVSTDELLRGGIAQRIAEFRDGAAGRPVYVCFDMDIFDPSVAPGVCTPSWGGLLAREGIDLLRALEGLDIVAFDVATVSPPQDVQNMAAHLCAHVVYEGLVLIARKLGLAPA
jgi:agmatinase